MNTQSATLTPAATPLLWNTDVERLARPELQALQLQRLRSLVERIYSSVPFFRQRYEAAGLSPTNLGTLDDIKRFPFSSKTDLADNYPVGLFAVPVSEISRIHASSGTKGKLTVGGYTENDLNVLAEVCARSMVAAGAHTKDVIQNSYGYGLFTGGLGMHYGAEKLGATIIPASGGQTQQQIMLLQDFGARVLCATPSYALNLAYTMEEHRIPRDTIKLEIGIFGAESWTDELRQQLEEKLGIAALDIYGISEIIGPGVSMECIEGRSGLHIWEDHFYPEIIDSESGEVLPAGVEGELVLSSITRQGMPLLRYRTGDITALIDEPCRCGRTMRRMQRVRGRVDDMLIVRGVNLYPCEIESQLLRIEELSPHYQIVIARDRALDRLEIEVEVTEEIIARWGHVHEDNIELSELSNKIMAQLKEALRLSAVVKLLPPRTLPRSQGKSVRVIDKRAMG